MRPETDDMFEKYPKTLPEPDETPMYESSENIAEIMSEVYGSPLRKVRAKIDGAFPETASPSMVFSDKYSVCRRRTSELTQRSRTCVHIA